MECPGCGRSAPDGVKFCGACGTRLDLPQPPPPKTHAGCPDCGADNAPGAKFCRQCGARLGGAAATEVTPPPPPVLDAVLPPVIEVTPPQPPPAPPPAIEVAPPELPPAPPPLAEVAPPPGPPPSVPPAPRFEEQIPADFSAPIPPPPAPEPPAPTPVPQAASADDLSDRTVLRAPPAVACPTCGATNVANAPQCRQCGQPFITAAAPPAAPEVDPDATVLMARGAPAPQPAPSATPEGFPGGLEPQVMDLSAIESPAPSAPPPQRPQAPARRGPSGLLLGLGVAFVLLALVAGAGVVTYLKIIKPARQALATAISSAPAASQPVATATEPPSSIQFSASTPAAATTANVAQAQPATQATTAVAQPPATATAQTAATPPQTADTGTPPMQQAQAPTEAPPASAPVEPQAAPPPTVDPAVQLASERTRRGERAYARGDYETAISAARSALDAKPGFKRAERLIRRAQDAQARIADQQMQQQAEAARARAAAAAAAPPKPTPDEIYNQRAHDECHRGFFGKSCRHKIREQVCQGVPPGTAGATVCSGKDN